MSTPKQEEDSAVFTSQELIAYRKSLNLTQKQFAEKFEIPLGTVRNWEQDLCLPNISLNKLNVCNVIISWKQKQNKIRSIIAEEKKYAKYRIEIGKSSPLRYKMGETQGEYWNRLAGVIRSIIDRKLTSITSIKRLAFATQELPIDFDSCDQSRRKNIFKEVQEFMSPLGKKAKEKFKQTYIAHKPGYEKRLSWIIP